MTIVKLALLGSAILFTSGEEYRHKNSYTLLDGWGGNGFPSLFLKPDIWPFVP